jgi:type IV secretion system protein VirD4
MINQSVNQIVKYYGPHNTVMDGAHVHVYYAPNTEETAKKISDLLGTKTEVHTQENFAGHRLAPWLGHIMVSRQQTARALLTPGEVRELPASEELIIVAGLPPIRARKLRFHADSTFNTSVPPTDSDGRLTCAGHPLNPPANLSQRPYPYGPPAPEPEWRISHAKSARTGREVVDATDGLEQALPEELEPAGEVDSVPAERPSAEDAKSRAGVFGFNDHDRHSAPDPDLGWNLPT